VSSWRSLAPGEEACRAESAAAPSGADAFAAPEGSKFDRILRFVEQHDLAGTCSSSVAGLEANSAAPQWHNSYDEEAEEGDEALPAAGPAAAAYEAAQLALAAASLSGADVYAVAPACSVAFLYPSDARAAAAARPAVPGAVGTMAYFMSKPIDQSYDEEAEGCYEAASAEAAALRTSQLASFMERRAESRAASRARRAALRSSPGDLEAMAAWVDDAAAAKAAEAAKRAAARIPASRYPNLQAFLAARAGALDAVEAVIDTLQRERGLQARSNQAWQYTWDEEVHGALSSM
jgi:hypothetical protein